MLDHVFLKRGGGVVISIIVKFETHRATKFSTAGPLFIFAKQLGNIPHLLRLKAVVGEEQPRIWKIWVRCQGPFLEEIAVAAALAPDNKYADEKDERRDESHDAASGDSNLVMMMGCPRGPKGQGWCRSD